MPWFRLDDSFDTHPKVLLAGNEAIGLYIRCGTYAARNLTDGAVPRDLAVLYGAEIPRTLSDGATETLAGTLVRVRLWHRAGARGWAIHDYLDYNPSREEVLAKRQIRSEAGRAGGLASGKVRSKPEANRSSSVEPPSRPDPYISGTGLSSATGGRLPSSKTPSSRPVGEVLRPEPGHRPASPEVARAAAAAARQAMAAKLRPP